MTSFFEKVYRHSTDHINSGGFRFGGRELCEIFGGPFPMWSTQKSSGPFHAKMLWQRHVSCASVY